jgi:hypothetical protein
MSLTDQVILRIGRHGPGWTGKDPRMGVLGSGGVKCNNLVFKKLAGINPTSEKYYLGNHNLAWVLYMQG